MYRVNRDGKGLGDAETIEGALAIVGRQPTGHYGVDEIQTDPFPSGHSSRSWVRMIRHPDGRGENEPWPWEGA